MIAGRTAQEYNQRKKRKGAFWEDRYHAVAVETEEHLMKRLVYIDLNMVRTGVNQHPSEWDFGGHNEILKPLKRYRLIDRNNLLEKYGYSPDSENIFVQDYEDLFEESLKSSNLRKQQ